MPPRRRHEISYHLPSNNNRRAPGSPKISRRENNEQKLHTQYKSNINTRTVFCSSLPCCFAFSVVVVTTTMSPPCNHDYIMSNNNRRAPGSPRLSRRKLASKSFIHRRTSNIYERVFLLTPSFPLLVRIVRRQRDHNVTTTMSPRCEPTVSRRTTTARPQVHQKIPNGR